MHLCVASTRSCRSPNFLQHGFSLPSSSGGPAAAAGRTADEPLAIGAGPGRHGAGFERQCALARRPTNPVLVYPTLHVNGPCTTRARRRPTRRTMQRFGGSGQALSGIRRHWGVLSRCYGELGRRFGPGAVQCMHAPGSVSSL